MHPKLRANAEEPKYRSPASKTVKNWLKIWKSSNMQETFFYYEKCEKKSGKFWKKFKKNCKNENGKILEHWENFPAKK